MAARRHQVVDLEKLPPPHCEPQRPREAAEHDVGDPNPAILDQLHRLAEFAADGPEPGIVRYSGRIRALIFLAAIVVPWALIALVAKSLLHR